MEYLKASFTLGQVQEYQVDILIDQLAQVGFDSFEETDLGFDAFVIVDNFDKSGFETLVKNQDFEIKYELSKVAAQNWNEEWERNFNPLFIDDQCAIRATFHQPEPNFPYEIIIDPKMAFGTGHHQTTTMMIKYILEEEFVNDEILDMGAGTAILAILAAKKEAKELVAIDYDEVCYESALENAKLNHINNLISIHGGKEAIPQKSFDVIFANINRNILLDQMESYAKVLKSGGRIFFSGFYESPDLEIIKESAQQNGFEFQNHKVLQNWTAAKFIKIK